MLKLCRFYCAIALFLFVQLVGARSFRQPPINSATVVTDARIISWQRKSDTVHCTSSFTLVFHVPFPDHNSQIRLSLEPNHELLHDATVEFLGNDGTTLRTEAIVRNDHKVYKGQAYVRDEQTKQWQSCGWTRIMVLRDGENPLFEGVFIKDGDIHHVKLLSKYNSLKHMDDVDLPDADPNETMVVYRDSDRFIAQALLLGRSIDGVVSSEEANSSMCGHDRLVFNTQGNVPSRGFGWDTFSRLVRRQSDVGGSLATGGSKSSLAATIGNTVGCPSTRQVALVAAAADCTYVQAHGNATTTRAQIISIYNSASAIYEEQLNITLGLSSIVMTDAQCPSTAPASAPWNTACNSSFSMDNNLNIFSAWRGERGDDGIALWTLLTGCSSGAEVGVAWLGMLCQYKATSQGGQTVSGANVVSATTDEWKVLAHETGHGFGAYHDCTSQSCGTSETCCPLTGSSCNANQQFIMNPTTMDATNRFSPCSVGNICSGFATKAVSGSCLTSNRNVTLITAGECGNGIVEEGEECDCGGAEACAGNSCCDPTTCKFTTGSVCDDSNDVCCQSCRFAPNTKVCRPSINNACDPQETCTGNSSACPVDITSSDGMDCGNGLQCAGGSCTSRDLQCTQSVNGSTGSCDSGSCLLSCSTTALGPNTCLIMQQNFVDGTPCGYGGRCQNGSCEGGGAGAAISSWIQQNKTIVIVIASVLGSLLLLCLASCIWRRCRGRKVPVVIPPKRYGATPLRSAPPPPRQPSMAYYPNAPPTAQPNYSNHAPPYAAPYTPPMRSSPRNVREQQPGEEWVQGADGSYYPPNRRNMGAPAPPARARPYWED